MDKRLAMILQKDIIQAIDDGFNGHDVKREVILDDLKWLIQTIEQQQEELNYYKMKHENIGAVMSRSHLLMKIQEKDAEIERLKDELDNVYFELRTR